MTRRDEPRHPGIRIHAIPVAGVGGVIFALGAVAIVLLGIPIAKWFLLASALGGLVAFGVIRLRRK